MTMTVANKLKYAMATVMLELIGHKYGVVPSMEKAAKIKATWQEVCQLPEWRRARPPKH